MKISSKRANHNISKSAGKCGRRLFDGKSYEVVLQKLETAWALDCTDAEAAALADISSAALSDLLKKHPDISERKTRLKQKPFLAARTAILGAIAAGDANLALKYMERKKKDEFSTRQEVTMSEQDPYDELSDSQLALIALGKASPADYIK